MTLIKGSHHHGVMGKVEKSDKKLYSLLSQETIRFIFSKSEKMGLTPMREGERENGERARMYW